MCTEIAAAAEQQNKTSREIDTNIGNINDLASETAADTDHVAQSNRRLTGMAEQLQQLLQQFRV